MKTQRAVSIIELLVVVVILLIFSTLTAISYHNMSRGLAARSQANEFNAAFVLARELAITNSQSHRVVIDLPTSRMWIDRMDPAGSAIESPQVTGIEPFLPQARLVMISVNGTVEPSTGRAEIYFRADGSSDRAKLHITQQGANDSIDSDFYTIELYPPSARARIYPNERR